MADDIDAWAGDQRARAAADARVRERWLRQQAVEGADLHGLLLGLAEKAEQVVVGLTNRRRHQGTVTGVGIDVVTLGGRAGQRVHVAIGAIASVQAGPQTSGRPDAGAARRGPQTGRLAHVLADEATERPRVVLGLEGGETVSGELCAVGTDVLTVHADGDTGGTVYVRLGSVCDASFFGSG